LLLGREADRLLLHFACEFYTTDRADETIYKDMCIYVSCIP